MERRGSEENHEKRARSEKCTKWQFVIATLFRDCNQKDTDDAAEKRTDKDRHHGALQSQKRAHRRHHFYVAEAHAFAPANAKISFGNDPEQTASGGRSQSCVGE